MLDLGVTKVEIGVQHVNDEILAFNRRGCTVNDTAVANQLLRDAGLKVGFHIMPNLPGSSIGKDRELFRTLFDDPRFRPDFLKIYPTLVTPGSEIEALWKEGRYSPYSEEELIDLIAYGKSLLPAYVRLQRIQRDIPAKLIVAGSKHSNFRQLASERLIANGGWCRCIRCREIGRYPSGETPEILTDTYECAGGTEHFISSVAGDSLVGFARLRFPGTVFREELEESALLRELHVYGSIVPIGHDPSAGEQQHRSTGSSLLSAAEEIACGKGYHRISIMSGIGVRPYYRNHGYVRAGPYMQKEL
jgi:elongator complex protein 3